MNTTHDPRHYWGESAEDTQSANLPHGWLGQTRIINNNPWLWFTPLPVSPWSDLYVHSYHWSEMTIDLRWGWDTEHHQHWWVTQIVSQSWRTQSQPISVRLLVAGNWAGSRLMFKWVPSSAPIMTSHIWNILYGNIEHSVLSKRGIKDEDKNCNRTQEGAGHTTRKQQDFDFIPVWLKWLKTP